MSQFITPSEARRRMGLSNNEYCQADDHLQDHLKDVLDAIDKQTQTYAVQSYRLPKKMSYERLRATLASLGWRVNLYQGVDCGCITICNCHHDAEGTLYEYYTVSW